MIKLHGVFNDLLCILQVNIGSSKTWEVNFAQFDYQVVFRSKGKL
jgi:hypothetical protein